MNRSMLLVLAGSWIIGCGGPLEYKVPSSALAPGADAHIVADVREKERQTQLNVEITNLPPPDRLDQAGKHYVAWYRRDSGEVWSRIAVLAYEPEAREANLATAVPEVEFEFEITAEPESEVVSPSPTVVFSQLVGEKD